ncbi:SDR family NAD(P)-dependent oxidoreductase [Streptomyces sp. NPDC091217]|uniref:SDR family NAD(P)-dependent oxidoreductase n=1 Tax=Streptomyces sp. NPDC091217 TaxID=3365975 RepID=UPI0037FB1E4C
MDLERRTALVTGGTTGLGAVITEKLSTAGVRVFATYLGDPAPAREFCASLPASGSRCSPLPLDLQDESAVGALVEQVTGEGPLDILVNNAAWNAAVPFGDLDALLPEIWDRIYATNVRGPFLLSRAAAPTLRAAGGRIVNIASIGGLVPQGSSIAYATAKAALIHLTRCLAVSLAPEVAVNAVAPGLIEGTAIAANLPPTHVEGYRHRALLGRAATREDIADAVLAFCRTESVTGQVLPVDGGIFAV